MEYYKSKFTGKIVAANYARCLNYVYGRDCIDRLLARGDLEVVIEPTVEELVQYGGGSVAVLRYRELHPEVSWEEASTIVRDIKKHFEDYDD